MLKGKSTAAEDGQDRRETRPWDRSPDHWRGRERERERRSPPCCSRSPARSSRTEQSPPRRYNSPHRQAQFPPAGNNNRNNRGAFAKKKKKKGIQRPGGGVGQSSSVTNPPLAGATMAVAQSGSVAVECFNCRQEGHCQVDCK